MINLVGLFEKISIDSYRRPIAFSGNGYEYPPMYLWRKVPDEAVRAGWKRFLRFNEYFYPGIYLHIPFCANKCNFCQFFSEVAKSGQEIDVYLDYLEKEAGLYSSIFGSFAWRTLYIGGGTPSLLSLKQLERLFCGILYKKFNFSRCIQVAFEANPNSLDVKKLQLLNKYGVNRLTIGVQTLDEKVAKICGRPQKKKDVYAAFFEARRAGIDYINVDLMVGLPGQTSSSLRDTYEQIYKLKPDSVHFNPFSPSPTTQFTKSGGFLTKRDIDRRNKLLRLLKFMQKNRRIGNDEYDLPVSHFAGRNIQLVDQIQYDSAYLGLGCSASSHMNQCLRYVNFDNLIKYYQSLDKKIFPVFLGHKIGKLDEMIFYITANLRYKGASKEIFYKLFHKNIERVFPLEIACLEKIKKIAVTEDYIISRAESINEYLLYSKFFYDKKLLKKLGKVYSRDKSNPARGYLRNFVSA